MIFLVAIAVAADWSWWYRCVVENFLDSWTRRMRYYQSKSVPHDVYCNWVKMRRWQSPLQTTLARRNSMLRIDDAWRQKIATPNSAFFLEWSRLWIWWKRAVCQLLIFQCFDDAPQLTILSIYILIAQVELFHCSFTVDILFRLHVYVRKWFLPILLNLK